MITVNGIQIHPTLFPDNTSQCWKLPETIMRGRRWAFIEWNFTHEGEMMQIAQLRDLFAHSGIDASLYMPYLPYARQDKQINNQNTFALRTFAGLLNSLNFDRISCLDAHSDVAAELIKNLTVLSPLKYIQQVLDITKPNLILYPDKGARDRYSKIIDFPSIYVEKHRNQSTGEIESFGLVGNPLDQRVLILDDICDGGATFIKIAQAYRPLMKDLNLYITHGIFSKGLKPLFESGINRVFTAKGEASSVQGYLTFKPFQENK